MHRQKLKRLLEKYNPLEKEEKRFKKEMLNFMLENKDCFERSCSKGHFTSSAWLLNNDLTKVLLTHHAKLDDWFQLGGHCDGDPDVLSVAIKEAQEESGIEEIIPVSKEIFDIDIHIIPNNKKVPTHKHYDIRFLLKVVNDEKFKINRESKELKWFGKDKTKLPTKKESIIRMFEKWINISENIAK